MSDQDGTYPVTTEHVIYFGIIISMFAKLEHQMCIAAAGILGSDLGTAYILMGAMHYRQKRQTLTHLNATLGIGGAISASLKDLLNRLDRHSALRNWIAHAVWTNGRRADSIKPMQILLRSDTLRVIGHDHNEQDYTVDDFRNAASELDAIGGDWREFLETAGLEARVKAEIEEAKSRTGPPAA